MLISSSYPIELLCDDIVFLEPLSINVSFHVHLNGFIPHLTVLQNEQIQISCIIVYLDLYAVRRSLLRDSHVHS